MSQPPAPPPPPPPADTPPVLSTQSLNDGDDDVDGLLNDTDPSASTPAKGEDKSNETKDANETTDGSTDPQVAEEEIGDEYKVRSERGCTDILCCCLMIAFMVVWAGLGYVAFSFGKPYSIIYGTDYEGNYCGHSCSATAETSNCTAENILTKKYAHFPRITTDLMMQSDTIAQGQIPSFYTLCVDTCPKQWDIVCSYDFNVANPTWMTYTPLLNKVKSCLGATASLNKYIASLAPSALTGTLEASQASGAIESADYCAQVFTECDVTGVGTEMILNRCIPTETTAPSNTTERCVSPLSTIPCNASSSTRFDVDCVQDVDGVYFETLYKPTFTYIDDYFTAELEGDAKANCVTKQTYSESLTEELASSDQLSYIVNALKSVSALFADIVTAWQAIVAIGFGACMILSWFYVGLLRYCAPLLVWGSCILLELMFLLLTPWLLIRGGVININELAANATEASGTELTTEQSAGLAQVTSNSLMNEAETTEQQYYVWAGYAFGALAFVWLCCLVFLRKAIKMAIKIIQISTMAMSAMPEMVLFPLVTYFGIVLLAVVWLLIGILLQTAGNISSTALLNETASAAAALESSQASGNFTTSFNIETSYTKVEDIAIIDYLWLYHIFMGLWVNAFIQGVAMLTIAGSVSKWYFTPTSVMKKKQGYCPVFKAYCITCRFHLGTVAFGSLIIAIVQTIRIVVGYIQKQMEQSGESKLKKMIMCMIQCCLWCLEKCVKFISKNAYIYTSLTGSSFCFSAFKSFFLILNNLSGFGMTSMITTFLLLIGKVSCVVSSIYFCYMYLTYDAVLAAAITSEIMPMVATGLIAFFVANSFFVIVANVMDSVLLNYCVDLQRKGNKAADDKLGGAKLPSQTDQKEEEAEPEAKCCKCCSCFNCCCRLCFDKKAKKGSDGNSKVSPETGKAKDEELI